MYNYLESNKISSIYFDSLASVKLFLMECEKDDRIRWSAGQNPLYEYHHFAENDSFPTFKKLRINCYYYEMPFKQHIELTYMFDSPEGMRFSLECDPQHIKKGIDILKQVCNKKYMILNEGDI